MSRITGIGGVFLNLDTDTKQLLKWYSDVLGLDVSDYGINFLEPNLMTLITFNRKPDDEAILNFAVDDLDDYVDKLKDKDVEVHKEVDTYPFGKFAQIKDIAGNIIELCQLNDDKYAAMVQEEIKQFKDKT